MNQLEHGLCFWDLVFSILQKMKKHSVDLHQRCVLEIQDWMILILGVPMESAIYNGFKCHNQELPRLACVRHLKKRDEEKLIKLLQERNQSSAQKSHSKAEVLNDIYGEKTATYCKYGLSESYDTDNFNAKLISLKEKWYAIIPGFYGWLISIEKPYS